MNKVTKFLAPIALLTSVGAHADFVGGSIEAAYWHAGVAGDATFGPATIDAEDQLNFSEDSNFEVAVTLEHPVPLIPNVRLKYTDIDQDEEGDLLDDFDGVTAGEVESNLNLSHADLILYYEILDNWVSLDIGIDVKAFDGQLEIVGQTVTSTTDIDEFIPLAYISTEFELPLTDLSFGAEVSAISYSGDSIYDGKVRFRQGISLAFIELGYRQMGLKVDDVDDVDFDVTFGGAYLSTGIDF